MMRSESPNREFSVVTQHEDSGTFKIDTKHRREQYHATLDAKLYSSLRYQFRVRCSGSRNAMSSDQTLRAILTVCDETHNTTLEDQEECVEGTLSAALVPFDKDPSVLYCNLLVHLKSHLSYHFTRKDYKILITILDHDDNEVAKLLSPSFRLFARKPNKKQYSRIKKRKVREADDDDDVAIAPLRKKVKLDTEHNAQECNTCVQHLDTTATTAAAGFTHHPSLYSCTAPLFAPHSTSCDEQVSPVAHLLARAAHAQQFQHFYPSTDHTPSHTYPTLPMSAALLKSPLQGLDSGCVSSESSFQHVYPGTEESFVAPFDALSTMAMYQHNQIAYNLLLQQQMLASACQQSAYHHVGSSSNSNNTSNTGYAQPNLLPYGAPLNY